MSATDFPRGWTMVAGPSAAALTLTVAAITGVAHVIDSFTFVIYNTAATPTALELVLNSSDGTFSNYALGLAGPSSDASDSDSDTGLDLRAGPGASLTISTGAAVTGFQYLRVLGHDI